jgi:hypothetical protein
MQDRACGFFRVILVAACLAAAPVRAADYTDLWYIPAESGWGANVVQSDSFMFVTFFIYGSDNKPTWYSAELAWDGAKFFGALYATQGTNWALPWNRAEHPAPVQVGTASFQPDALNAYQATLTWQVNGTGAVTKQVERITLTPIALGGTYVGGQAGGYTSCSNGGDNGPYTDKYTLTVAQTAGGVGTFTFSYDSGATCTLSGTLEQHGPLYRIPGASYQCTGSLNFSTTATMHEIRATAQGIEGRLAATLPSGCRENANFSAVLR